MIEVIAAIGKNREIGKDNQLIFRHKDDMKFFQATTMGKTVVMGRKTFESIGKVLPGRRNIIISRTLTSVPGAEIFTSIESVLNTYQSIIIIGGQEIYQQTIALADVLFLTHFNIECKDADSFFPDYSCFSSKQLIKRIDKKHAIYRYSK